MSTVLTRMDKTLLVLKRLHALLACKALRLLL